MVNAMGNGTKELMTVWELIVGMDPCLVTWMGGWDGMCVGDH